MANVKNETIQFSEYALFRGFFLLGGGFRKAGVQVLVVQGRVEKEEEASQGLLAPHRVDSKEDNVPFSHRHLDYARLAGQFLSALQHSRNQELIGRVEAHDDAHRLQVGRHIEVKNILILGRYARPGSLEVGRFLDPALDDIRVLEASASRGTAGRRASPQQFLDLHSRYGLASGLEYRRTAEIDTPVAVASVTYGAEYVG